MEDIEKVKRAILATIESSAKQDHLIKDGQSLAQVVPFLNGEIGIVFCRKLFSVLRVCFSTVHQLRKESTREKALTQFHAARISELPPLWMALFSDLSLSTVCPLLIQCVNRNIFEEMIVEHFAESVAASCSNSATEAPTMNAEEENALRYVSGYVALKLMRKYEKEEGEKAMQFVECLSNMAVTGEESGFYNYTKQLIDRGGLFHINDSTYCFFKAIEVETRQILPHRLTNQSNSRDALLEGCEDVLFYWSMLSVDIHTSNDADELLHAVIKQWVTIRGYSLTATWVEQYKRAAQQSNSKKKALRKELRQHNL